MKKLITTFIVLALLITPMISTQAANSITERLSGRLLLQVQDGGRIWWVDPVGKDKYEVTFANAMDLFRSHALGISNQDLSKIQVNLSSVHPSADADHDGFKDREEILSGHNPFGSGKQILDNNLAKRLAGRILLQVEDRGRVWYVDPVTILMYEVKFATLMDMFRSLALGVTNEDLEMVGEWRTYTNSNLGFKFDYPSEWGSVVFEQRACGEGGNLYRAEFSSGVGFRFGGNSKECFEGRGAEFLDFMGYKHSGDNVLHQVSPVKNVTLEPSEFSLVSLEDGGQAVMAYGLPEPNLYLSGGEVGVLINLKDEDFSGLAFFGLDKSILQQILSTFRFTDKEQEIAFDGCGEIDKYKNQSWYNNFIYQASQIKRENSFDQKCKNVNNKEISCVTGNISEGVIKEMCYSAVDQLVLAIAQGVYLGPGFKMLKYNIQTNQIEIADRSDNREGEEVWIAPPNEFGPREGDAIKLYGREGDAGCWTNTVFDYDFVENYISLIGSESGCE